MTAPVDVLGAWASRGGGWSPLDALKQAKETPWIVDGVIPANSIVWVVGDPACGKTFTMLDLAACVSSGRPWHGRQCDQATVVYVAAEGGADIHIRRACAELAAGTTGDLLVVQARPMIAEPEGIAEVMGLVQEATGGETLTGGGITFDLVEKAKNEAWWNFKTYLPPADLSKFDDMERFEALTDRKNAGERLRDSEVRELAQLGQSLAPWTNTASLEEWASEKAESLLPAELRAAYKYLGCHMRRGEPSKQVLLIIDTFSQTASSDEKTVVSQYIKHLRDLIEQAEHVGGSVSVIVVDHFTKSGSSFMGAQAKQGDSDAMIEIERRGDLVTVSCPDKMKAAKPFAHIHLALEPYVLEGHLDSMGRPLTSLIVQDGEKIYRARKAAGSTDETAAAVVMRLLDGAAGPVSRDELRSQYLTIPVNEGKTAESVKRAFNRALEGLAADGLVSVVDGVVRAEIEKAPA